MLFRRSSKKLVQTDDDLLRLYKSSGDVAYLGELYERYLHLVFGVCMKYLGDEEESKDMSMHIFEKLVECTRTTEIENFGGWLHVLAKNECLMLIRSRKYKIGRSSVEIKEDRNMDFAYWFHPTEEGALEVKLQQLEHSIEELPLEQKECIRLFYLEHKCYQAISQLTGYELKKVKSYIQNGKRNLKRYMQKVNE